MLPRKGKSTRFVSKRRIRSRRVAVNSASVAFLLGYLLGRAEVLGLSAEVFNFFNW